MPVLTLTSMFLSLHLSQLGLLTVALTSVHANTFMSFSLNYLQILESGFSDE